MNKKDIFLSADKCIEDFKKLQKAGLIPLSDDFFPGGTHYPLITQYPKIAAEEAYKDYKRPQDGMMDLYVHLPFCMQRCVFCHYPALYRASDEEKDKYIEAIEKEFEIVKMQLKTDKIKFRVALVGGGTPTDLSPKQLERFLQIIAKNCDMSMKKQYNFDVSPYSIIGKTGKERLKILKDYGVDRLTIGLQTADNRILQTMNRNHTKEQGLDSVHLSKEFGFQTEVEYIYGYPGQSIESWYNELQEIAVTEADEIQFYRLKIAAYGDQQGNIKKYSQIHRNELPSVEDTIRMRKMIFDYLADFGWQETLRRIFAKDKSKFSYYLYNQYCEMYDEIGLGTSAFSSLRDRFIINTADFNEYYKKIEAGKLPLNRGIVRDRTTQQRWALVLPLKNDYLKKDIYKNITGVKIEETPMYNIILKLKEFDLLEEDDKSIRLSKKGIIFADEIIETFYSTCYQPIDRKHYNTGELNPYILSEKYA